MKEYFDKNDVTIEWLKEAMEVDAEVSTYVSCSNQEDMGSRSEELSQESSVNMRVLDRCRRSVVAWGIEDASCAALFGL